MVRLIVMIALRAMFYDGLLNLIVCYYSTVLHLQSRIIMNRINNTTVDIDILNRGINLPYYAFPTVSLYCPSEARLSYCNAFKPSP